MKGFIVLLTIAAMKLSAQPLNGIVTINSGVATQTLSQPYNFQTFTAFAATLNALGVNGPLVVNVIANSGPYTEQPAFAAIPGISANNRVTINGNGNLLTFNSSSSTQPYTLLLNGSKFLSFNNLLISGTNASYAMVCILTNGADNNMFTACSFSCQHNGTSSYQIPFSFNSSTSLPTSGGNPGNNNTITSCTLSGGYYSIYHYGLSAAPFTFGNSFINCYITDFYLYSIYGWYAKNLTIKGCTFDRLVRTTLTTTYIMYAYYMQGLNFDSNIIQKLFDANQSYTGTMYGFYYAGYSNAAGPGVNRNVFKNNVIRNIEFAGSIYVFYYCYNSDNDFINNTISLDQTSQTTGNAAYAFYYCYGGSGYTLNFKNNNISITRGGPGTKYGMYFGGTTTGVTIDYNNIYVNSLGGGNNIGYFSGNATTFSQWQTQG